MELQGFSGKLVVTLSLHLLHNMSSFEQIFFGEGIGRVGRAFLVIGSFYHPYSLFEINTLCVSSLISEYCGEKNANWFPAFGKYVLGWFNIVGNELVGFLITVRQSYLKQPVNLVWHE